MIVVIHDANVLIDLQSAKLLDVFFRLDLDNHASDLVIHEIEQPLTSFIKSKKLQVRNWDAGELAEIAIARNAQPRQISIQDSSALFLARKLGGVLLTGDGNLRYCAEQAGVEVRGTLWIFDQLVASTLLPKRTAARLLEKLMNEGRRFPADACAQRLQKWVGTR